MSVAAMSGRLSSVLEHWLAIANAVVALFVTLPLLAPMLLSAGWDRAANAIYFAYQAVCHQWAFRSYFILGPAGTYTAEELRSIVGPDQAFGFLGNPELGYKVAFCERDVAIYLSVLLAGLLFALGQHWFSPLSIRAYLLAITPMAIDGFSQLFGWRESTPELRTITGALFGAASVWLIYPRLDVAIRQTRSKQPASTAVAGLSP